MRVLVTRPEPGGGRTAARLVLSGHDPIRMPLFETQVTAGPADLPTAAHIGGLIATSARAFALFETGDLQEKAVLDLPVHVVGPATARAAVRVGFSDIREGKGAARDLATALTSRRTGFAQGCFGDDPEDGRRELVYLAGVPRAAAIEDALKAAKVRFSVLECYKMNEISYSTDIIISDILMPEPDVVLLYSANAARRLAAIFDAENLGNTLGSAHFLCLSEAIADELPMRWRARSLVADHPDEDSLLASLAGLR